MDILTFTFANMGSYDPDRPVRGPPRSHSWTDSISISQAHHLVRRLMAGLHAHGVRKGDCVCLHTPNNIWYPLMCLGIVGLGAIVSGVNPASTAEEITRHYHQTQPQFLIAHSDHRAGVLAAAARCKIPHSKIFYHGPNGATPVSGQHWRVLMSHGEMDSIGVTGEHDALLDQPAFYATTSGTTGRPKIAVISHQSVIARTMSVEHLFEHRPSESRQLICLPLFHAFASTLGLLLPLRVGLPTYFLPRFAIEDFLRAVDRFAISDVPVVPTIVDLLIQLPPQSSSALRSLRAVICAGAALSCDLQLGLARILHPQAIVSQCWGTTEAGWHTVSDHHEQDQTGSVGRALPGVHLKLTPAPDERPSQDGAPGEVLVKSLGLFSGYLGDAEATRAAFDVDGYYVTGDCVRAEHGLIFYLGRTKEIMKVKGWQVSPTELEDVLLQHPMIQDAAVAGIQPSDLWGGETRPRAYVVRNSPDLSERDVQDFIATRLISYKHLTGGVLFVRALPRTDTGKIRRGELTTLEGSAAGDNTSKAQKPEVVSLVKRTSVLGVDWSQRN